MKTSSARAPVKRSSAMNCVLVNQFATPGLGSLMAGRIFAGTIQISLAVAGFLFVMGWFAQLFINTYREFQNQPPQQGHFQWMGRVGAILFAAAWVYAWFTSLSLLRAAQKNPEPPAAPPVLSNTPSSPPRQPPILKN